MCLLSAVWLTFPTGVRGNASESAGAQTVAPDRFSPLTQINQSNVAHLRLVFSFRSAQRGAQGGAPLVVGPTMYLLTPFPHTLFALDLTRSGAPMKWQFTPEADLSAMGLVCCDRLEQGPVYANDRIYFSTLDGRVVALNANTGGVAWNVRIAASNSAETLTTAPTVVGNELLVGNGGADFGARGWIISLDATSGRQLWKRYSTGPDSDIGIEPAGHDLGSSTWPSGAWQHGGGSVTSPVLYDSELKLLLHNTGPPAPWNAQQRIGDNKWTAGIFARDPQTGSVKWFTPLHSHSLYPRPAGIANIAVDATWKGADRKLLLHPDGDGRLYTLDRTTGRILSADPLLPTSTHPTPHIDLQVRNICPAWSGAVAGNPALGRTTGLLYVPLSRLCMDFEPREASYLQGTAFIGANVRVHSAPGEPRGGLVAWDYARHAAAWQADERFPVASDVLATAGNVVFYGTLDGTFKALDATDGKLLWQWRASTGIVGQPMTFEGVDGHQYIAVIAGVGGPYGIASEYWIDRRDATAARGLAQAIADLPAPKDPQGTLYVFGLP
jgi:PQQ-dependent dehydrogenase (methanol/ethanol family)